MSRASGQVGLDVRDDGEHLRRAPQHAERMPKGERADIGNGVSILHRQARIEKQECAATRLVP